MSEFFKSIPKIAYEGKNSKNPLAFKFYNPDEVIAGKTMREQLKFALSWWHTMGGDGTDMFGCGTTDKTWGCDDVTARAKAKVEAAFEIMDKLSIDYYCFHDRDHWHASHAIYNGHHPAISQSSRQTDSCRLSVVESSGNGNR